MDVSLADVVQLLLGPTGPDGLVGLDHTVALSLGALVIPLAALLAWWQPTPALMLALASLALRPQILWAGTEVGYEWELNRTLLVLALGANGIRHGFRSTTNWPILALLIIVCCNSIAGQLHSAVDPGLMIMSLAIFALPWVFTQVVFEPGSRQKHALILMLVPLLSVALEGVLSLFGVRPLVAVELKGTLRLQGAAGIPADLALLAFGGFALALHESTRTTRRSFTWFAYANFMLVVLSGGRMAIAASALFFLTYLVIFPPMRERLRQNLAGAGLGLGIVAAGFSLYLPYLELRMLDAADGALLMSGRDEMWSFYWHEFLLSPLFGRGLGAGFVAFAEHTDFGLPTPHNEYLHALVIGGVTGFVLFFGSISLWFRALVRTVRWDDRAFIFAVLPALALYAITENLLLLPSALPVFAYFGILLTERSRTLMDEPKASQRTSANNREDAEPEREFRARIRRGLDNSSL